MLSSAMAVSPRETIVGIRKYCWRGLACASLLLMMVVCIAAAAPEARFFRIGTAATGGSFFEIGGVVAAAISGPTGGPACGHGGTCGVPGLVAVAQATPGSIENLRQINSGQIESGFAQADLAGWAYHGSKIFAEAGAQRQLRTIASLFPEAAHLVVRADSPIHKLADLKGKRVSLGESGSGTAADAVVFLSTAGFREKDLTRKFLRPGPAAEELKSGEIDAFFLVGGYPVPAIRDLASTIPIRLVPFEDALLDKLKKDFTFYHRAVIPAGLYPGIDGETVSLGFYALWLVNADIDADLVYAITQSLWHQGTRRLLDALDPLGKRIQLDQALNGLSAPLHPGAVRYYREQGLPVENAPKAADAGGSEQKQP
jgi:TRAP transporter TAXI family solute receptor